ncbi:MAG TPA: hypothetical protein VIP79_03100 [Gemmatimonadaceae bacterium]|jgi:hypothetical protein
MATKLEKTLKREVEIDGQAYMVAISPEGVKLTQKGFRKGPELTWKQILATGGGDSGNGGESSAGGSATGSTGGTGWLGGA